MEQLETSTKPNASRKPTPILILSDSPLGSSGLGRITRDLADRIHATMPEFRVATFGLGTPADIPRPLLPDYPRYQMTGLHDYIPVNFAEVWQEFTQGEPGVLLTIWNPAWCWWLVKPELIEAEIEIAKDDPELVEKLELRNRLRAIKELVTAKPNMKLWGYFPIDGDCTTRPPDLDQFLPESTMKLLRKYDRVLCYTDWAANLATVSWNNDKHAEAFDYGPVDSLPHGLDTSVFYPRSRKWARKSLHQRTGNFQPPATTNPLDSDSTLLIGCVATNSARKDWGLAFQTCAELLTRGVDVYLWCHASASHGFWNLTELADIHGMRDRIIPSRAEMLDDDLAWCYSACDVTLGIGSGEGWGYPIAESMACGVPCVTGNYAGATDYVPAGFLVEPVAFRLDGFFCIRRPVYSPQDWATKIQEIWRFLLTPRVGDSNDSLLPDYISWDNCWPRWQDWLRASLPSTSQSMYDDITAVTLAHCKESAL